MGSPSLAASLSRVRLRKSMFLPVFLPVASFMEREMTSPEGPFYSAIDADSENEEGKFYTWRATEILPLLGTEEADVFMSVYNCDLSGNYIGPGFIHQFMRKANSGPELDI